MYVTVNGKPEEVPAGTTLAEWVNSQGLRLEWVAVAVDGEVIPRDRLATFELREGMRVEVVTAMAGGSEDVPEEDPLVIAGVRFRSRLFVGTGKYPDMATMRAALRASGTELVTVAVRLLSSSGAEPILPHLEQDRYRLLPNTAGARNAEEAVYIARLGRELTGSSWVKLEVIGEPKTLWPDTEATVAATKTLVRDGFVVLAYTSPDLVAGIRLQEAGASAVMPLAAPIGSGQGLQDWAGIARLREFIEVPLVVDAGIGVPSDAAMAMELGADAVLINTAIARAGDPVRMAEAMRLGVEAGRKAYRAGRIPRRPYAEASSPAGGVPGR